MFKNISAIDHLFLTYTQIKTAASMAPKFVKSASVIKNWYMVVPLWLGLIDGFKMQLASGKVIDVHDMSDYFAFWESKDGQIEILKMMHVFDKIRVKNKVVELNWRRRKLKFYYDSEKQLVNVLALIKEQFFKDQYAGLQVKDEILVDIGASIGDTAIYFAMRGAKKIFAFEPFPYAFEVGKHNITLNGILNTVKFVNAGCGGKHKSIKIKENFESMDNTILKNDTIGKTVEILSLEDIVTQYDIKDAILKMDCEGCEYDTILQTNRDTLRRFKQLVIEYHYGYINLVSKLKETGFEVTKTRPNLGNRKTNRYVRGLILAKRIDK